MIMVGISIVNMGRTDPTLMTVGGGTAFDEEFAKWLRVMGYPWGGAQYVRPISKLSNVRRFWNMVAAPKK